MNIIVYEWYPCSFFEITAIWINSRTKLYQLFTTHALTVINAARVIYSKIRRPAMSTNAAIRRRMYVLVTKMWRLTKKSGSCVQAFSARSWWSKGAWLRSPVGLRTVKRCFCLYGGRSISTKTTGRHSEGNERLPGRTAARARIAWQKSLVRISAKQEWTVYYLDGVSFVILSALFVHRWNSISYRLSTVYRLLVRQLHAKHSTPSVP